MILTFIIIIIIMKDGTVYNNKKFEITRNKKKENGVYKKHNIEIIIIIIKITVEHLFMFKKGSSKGCGHCFVLRRAEGSGVKTMNYS